MSGQPGGFVDAFSDTAELYARTRPAYPEALIAELAALAPSRRGAWDCGTGNGQAALGLARHFEHVEASDPSAEQIAQALPAARVRYSIATRAERPRSRSVVSFAAQALLVRPGSLHARRGGSRAPGNRRVYG
jgi:hypothetical protein